MCYIPRNFHTNSFVWNATVYMKDGSHLKWQLTKYDAARIYKLWTALFKESFNGVKISDIRKISFRSIFNREDDFVLA